jgi:putative sterol carrier protein
MQAFMQGKIKPKGNMGMIMKLQPLQPKLEKIRDRQAKKAKL